MKKKLVSVFVDILSRVFSVWKNRSNTEHSFGILHGQESVVVVVVTCVVNNFLLLVKIGQK